MGVGGNQNNPGPTSCEGVRGADFVGGGGEVSKQAYRTHNWGGWECFAATLQSNLQRAVFTADSTATTSHSAGAP